MADSQTLDRAPYIELEEAQTFSLSCGCLSVTRNGKLSEVRWCPRHATMHGTMGAHDRRDSGATRP